jgi:hypothetical protein
VTRDTVIDMGGGTTVHPSLENFTGTFTAPWIAPSWRTLEYLDEPPRGARILLGGPNEWPFAVNWSGIWSVKIAHSVGYSHWMPIPEVPG